MNSYSDNPIWRALETMRIEPEGAALTFTARLARENRWSGAYAGAVMREYRRFLYLAATLQSAVTPSDDVDRAWHLHLTYSRHYWDELCAKILARPLHHGPTEGGAEEDGRYLRQYDETLAVYRDTFGEEPPVSVWPNAATRFAVRPVTIDAARMWAVPKALGGRAAAIGGATLLAACSAMAATGASDGDDNDFGIFIGLAMLVFIVFVVTASIRAQRGKRGDGSGCGSGGSGCGSSDRADSGSDSSSGCGGGGCGGGD